MSVSQWRYLDYFDQVLLHGFIPLSRSLSLNKMVIMHDQDEQELDPLATQQESQKNCFYFRVYQGKPNICVFDQLELN